MVIRTFEVPHFKQQFSKRILGEVVFGIDFYTSFESPQSLTLKDLSIFNIKLMIGKIEICEPNML